MFPIGKRKAVLGKTPYFQKVLGTRRANLIQYFPLWEPSGAVAIDKSSQANNGSYTSITLGATGFGDGKTGAGFSVAGSNVNLYSVPFVADFNGDEGTMTMWAYMANWGNGAQNMYIYFATDSYNDTIYIQKLGSNVVRVVRDTSNDSGKLSATAAQSGAGWKHLAATWSDSGDAIVFYLNGVAQTAATGLGAWVGTPGSTKCTLGNNEGANVFAGTLQHWAMWNVALTQSEIANLAKV